MKLLNRPFKIGEIVKPHCNFSRQSGLHHTEVTIRDCFKGFCQSGWLVTIEEWKRGLYEGEADYTQYDSEWFSTLKGETRNPKPNWPMYATVTSNFRMLMMKELAANFNKGDRDGERGWLTMTNKQALSELYYHVGKLQHAIKEENIDLIKEYCADIANGALMCCDKFYPLNKIIPHDTTGTGTAK